MELHSKNYFEMFSLPVGFQVDTGTLNKQYKTLQSQYHPDKFVGADEESRLRALQLTSLINEAYNTLKSPLHRAAYLLSMKGVNPEDHNQAHLGEEFLLRQLELRESLEQCLASENLDALDALKRETLDERRQLLESCEELFNKGALTEAKSRYNRLQFLYKLLEEIELAEEKLLDY